MEQAHETAIGTCKYEKTKHIGAIDIVAAEFEAGQRKVQVPARLIDQIALIMTA